MSTLTIKKQHTNFNIDPVLFTVYLFLVSVSMLFAGFTSGYIVRKSQGDWVSFEMPQVFLYSCFVVIAASLSMGLSQYFYKKAKKSLMQVGLVASLIIGLIFIYTQYLGWKELTEQGVYLVGNPSGSFMFIISGAHAVHLIFGVLVILVALLRSFVLNQNEIKTQKITAIATYWHFVGVLWLYLYVFLSNA